MNGMIVFYINFQDGDNHQAAIEMLRTVNKAVFDKITSETGYEIAIFPTKHEACRIEKIDMDKPFPRFSIHNVDLDDRSRRRKKPEVKPEEKQC